jgi:HSP20 family protein
LVNHFATNVELYSTLETALPLAGTAVASNRQASRRQFLDRPSTPEKLDVERQESRRTQTLTSISQVMVSLRHDQGRMCIRKERKIMKTLTTYNPFREMEQVQNRLSTFFGGFPTFPIRFPKNEERFQLPDWSPLMDIIEDDHEYLFKVDLPEMKKDDVKVTIENGILYISGERKFEKEEKKRRFHRLERFFGTFERTFTVPEDADATKIKAEFHDGVLQVHLPKLPIVKPKLIEAKVQ